MSKRKIYQNLDGVKLTTAFSDFIRWQQERRKKNKDYSYLVPQASDKKIEYLQSNRTTPTITSIGHCTFLIQMNGLNIVTDPVWAKRMGFAKRLTAPGIAIDAIPAIDIVLISHNHYDHLNLDSIRKLQGNPKIFVPSGLEKYLSNKGFQDVQEFEWWTHTTINNVEFHFVPAQHWSKRWINDTNCSHWGGWVIQDSNSQAPSIYFVGDSGYFRGFQQIGERYSIDYILAPIGAYEPEWFMKIQHTTPEQAVQACIDTRATYFIPMHHDAYRLGDDTSKEALDRLQKEWQRLELPASNLKTLDLGETIFISTALPNSHFYK